jgi:hypothetical protein
VLRLTRGAGAERLEALFNLSDRKQAVPSLGREGAALLFSSESARYSGGRTGPAATELLPYECLAFGPRSVEPLV